MPGLIDFFKNSPYFDRRVNAREVKVRYVQKTKDASGAYIDTTISEYTEPHIFISNVNKKLIQPEFLEKYDVIKYVYLSQKLTLQNKEFNSIIIIDGQIFKVLDDRDFDLTSGFYKYLIGGTGKNAV